MYKKILPIVLFFFSFSVAAQEVTSREIPVKVEIVKNRRISVDSHQRISTEHVGSFDDQRLEFFF
jgi:hypothetical protein